MKFGIHKLEGHKFFLAPKFLLLDTRNAYSVAPKFLPQKFGVFLKSLAKKLPKNKSSSIFVIFGI